MQPNHGRAWTLMGVGIVMLNGFRLVPYIATIQSPVSGLLANLAIGASELGGVACLAVGVLRLVRSRR